MEGTARDLTAFLEFERSLITNTHFDRVEPERSTHTKNGEILFQLSFLYDPEGHARSAESAQAPETTAATPDAGGKDKVPEDPLAEVGARGKQE